MQTLEKRFGTLVGNAWRGTQTHKGGNKHTIHRHTHTHTDRDKHTHTEIIFEIPSWLTDFLRRNIMQPFCLPPVVYTDTPTDT